MPNRDAQPLVTRKSPTRKLSPFWRYSSYLQNSMPARRTLATLAADQLRAGIAVIERIEDAAWTASPAPIAASPVGAHFRHVFDHIDALLSGVADGIVDYDARARDVRIERDRSYALMFARRLEARLRALGDRDGDGAVRVLQDCGERGSRAATCSTWARELQFVVAHTTHHHAMIALLLRAAGMQVEASFGLAPSTLRHLESQSACAH